MMTLNVCEGFAFADVSRPGVVYAYLGDALAAVEAVSASTTTISETKPRPGLPQSALERVSPLEGLPQSALCRRSPFVPRSSRIKCSPCPFPSPPRPQGRVRFERRPQAKASPGEEPPPFGERLLISLVWGISALKREQAYAAQEAAAQLAAFQDAEDQLACAQEAFAQLAEFHEADAQLAFAQEALAQLAWFQE